MCAQVLFCLPSATNVSHAHECFRKATKQVKEGGSSRLLKWKSDFEDLSHNCFDVNLFEIDVKLKHKCTIIITNDKCI